METIKLKETRPLFLTKQGLPRKECLLTLDEICEELGKPISDDPVERAYQLQFARSIMSSLKRFFYQHHILFVAPRIEGIVYYGFTNDAELIENYKLRVHALMLSYRRIENEVKQIESGQLDLISARDTGRRPGKEEVES
jgi:hypothetical protein